MYKLLLSQAAELSNVDAKAIELAMDQIAWHESRGVANKVQTIEEEYIDIINDYLKVYPDTKRGNSDMRYRWEMLRSVKRGQENQIGLYMDWGENDTTHEDPKKRALALYFALSFCMASAFSALLAFERLISSISVCCSSA